MAEPSAPPLQDKSAPFSHQDPPMKAPPYQPTYPEPPPPYTPHAPPVMAVHTPAPQPSAPYPKQPPMPVMPVAPVQTPMQQMIVPPAQPAPAAQVVVVAGAQGLPPGTCTVYICMYILVYFQKGKMENSASFWTWLCCFLFLPVGILPSIIIFCCCCREPKCTNCGYTP